MFRTTAFSVYILILFMSCIGFGFQLVRFVGAATTWTVGDGGPADFHTIQDAINAARAQFIMNMK